MVRIPLSRKHAEKLRVCTLKETQNFTLQSRTRKAHHTAQTPNRKLLIHGFLQAATQSSGSEQLRTQQNIPRPPLCHSDPGGVNLKKPARQSKATTATPTREVLTSRDRASKAKPPLRTHSKKSARTKLSMQLCLRYELTKLARTLSHGQNSIKRVARG